MLVGSLLRKNYSFCNRIRGGGLANNFNLGTGMDGEKKGEKKRISVEFIVLCSTYVYDNRETPSERLRSIFIRINEGKL